MASHTSFQKRRKEIARLEKQRDKAARKMERRLAKKQPAAPEAETAEDWTAPAEAPPPPIE